MLKTPAKQIIVFFQTSLEKSLICEILYVKWGSDFEIL